MQKIYKPYCSVEKSSECHFERAVNESRNPSTLLGTGLFLNRFLHFAALRAASVEMTVGLFNRAKPYIYLSGPPAQRVWRAGVGIDVG